ncbi:helix-turn-helix transcriptional regulator [Ralstonia sp. L16]|uniref:AlpA family phage regulatory protein n=1 Tax=Ralstonia mojiangensis TaxID=2953895 RepID=A0AAE3LDP1_9RALS|nr:AlpA family phage regulatory protein [Ralstonia mojiangensis]MCT7309721.1 AlpA family phage regulatory protein [Ralstonia mojiangensis]MCT7316776.1 AlpA family phage regulatory protein [Ralstonia mojiangensis]
MSKQSKPVIYLDLPSVAAAVALSETTVQQLVREQKFPRPRAISPRRVGWLLREVQEWAEKCPVSEFLPPPNCSRNQR